jgi:hypothetical protein
VEEMFPIRVTKYMDIHILPKLTSATTIYISFDLCMSKGSIDVFILVINYLFEAWELVHAIVGLFKVNETIDLCMA